VAVLAGGAVATAAWGAREDTRFQAASISKPVAALTALRLVARGLLELDADVNDYLRSWRLPARHGWAARVTVRHLLCHGGALTMSGYPGYPVGAPLPTLVEILDSFSGGEKRRCPGSGTGGWPDTCSSPSIHTTAIVPVPAGRAVAPGPCGRPGSGIRGADPPATGRCPSDLCLYIAGRWSPPVTPCPTSPPGTGSSSPRAATRTCLVGGPNWIPARRLPTPAGPPAAPARGPSRESLRAG
jgi:hypothetical protein